MPDQSHLTIDDGEEPGLLVLRGDLDSHSCQALAERLDTMTAAEPVVLDMQAVRFIDSSGLRALLTAHEARRQGAPLVLREPSRAVWRLLEITALTEHLTLEGEPPTTPV
jgi:anti-sigma B factor antagonist